MVGAVFVILVSVGSNVLEVKVMRGVIIWKETVEGHLKNVGLVQRVKRDVYHVVFGE